MRGVQASAEMAGAGPALTLLAGGRDTGLKPDRIGAPLQGETTALPVSLLALALDAMAEAAMFVGRGGRIVYANRAARSLLAAGDVLREVNGHIGPADAAQRGRLTGIINDAALLGSIGAASIIGQDGARVNLTAVPGDARGPAQVLLLASELRRGEGQLAQQLQQAFGLTAAEADIARGLGAGDSPADIARSRGASPGTVHCQIKSVAAKLGCRRQTEIAAIVQAMPRITYVEPAPVAAAVA